MTHRHEEADPRRGHLVAFTIGLAIGLAVTLGLALLPVVLHAPLYWSPV